MRRRRLLFALLPVLGLLLLAEGVARAYPPPDPATLAKRDKGGILMTGNPLLAWELAPGARQEDGLPVRINRERFRDRKRGPKGNLTRMLTLGDSTVYGFKVLDEQVFSSVLESRAPAEVINGGVPGYSTEQALNLLSLRGFALEPDVLIVATIWSDSNFDRFVDRDILARSDGVALRWAASNASALLGWAETYAVARRQVQYKQVGWVTEDKAAGTRRVPIDDYAKNLARFCELMEERDGGVVFVILPGSDDIVDTMPAPEPWQPYRTVMKETAAACGAPLVDLPAVFAARGDPALMVDTVHPSAAGHALIAETVEVALNEAGWPRSPLRVHAADRIAKVDDPFATQGDTYFQGMDGPIRQKEDRPAVPGGADGVAPAAGAPPQAMGGPNQPGVGGPGQPGMGPTQPGMGPTQPGMGPTQPPPQGLPAQPNRTE